MVYNYNPNECKSFRMYIIKIAGLATNVFRLERVLFTFGGRRFKTRQRSSYPESFGDFVSPSAGIQESIFYSNNNRFFPHRSRFIIHHLLITFHSTLQEDIERE